VFALFTVRYSLLTVLLVEERSILAEASLEGGVDGMEVLMPA
jgi:hypothetical protein